MSKQLDIEIEVLAAKRYEEHSRGVAPWVRRCVTVKDAYRAVAARELAARLPEVAP